MQGLDVKKRERHNEDGRWRRKEVDVEGKVKYIGKREQPEALKLIRDSPMMSRLVYLLVAPWSWRARSTPYLPLVPPRPASGHVCVLEKGRF